MAFALSPSVIVTEKDFTSIVPAVSTTAGAYAGSFAWGPVLDPVTITNENSLAQRFGLPNDNNFESFFTAANFLSYANNLLVVRTDATNLRNAVSTLSGTVSSVSITLPGAAFTSVPPITFSAPATLGGVTATGVAVLTGGSVITNSIIASGVGYSSAPNIVFSAPSISTGVTATGSAIVSGSVTSVILTSGGSSYTTPTVVFPAPTGVNGVNATGTAIVTSGVITGVTITNGGSGYLIAPTVSFTGSGAGAAGTVNILTSKLESVIIINGGSGYLVAPTISIFGSGSGAVITSTISGSGISGINIISPGTGYVTAPSVTIGGTGTGAVATSTIVTAGAKIRNLNQYQAEYQNGLNVIGEFAAKYPGTLGNSLTVSMADSQSFATWAYKNQFASAPGTSNFAKSIGGSNDELHIVVVDQNGLWSGTPGTILEKFEGASKASDAKSGSGVNKYYVNVLNSQSVYVWWTGHPVGTSGWGSSASKTFSSINNPVTRILSGGVDDYAPTDGNIIDGFSIFQNAEQYDVSLIPTGKVSATVANYIITNISEVRKDCVAFVSPVDASTGGVILGLISDQVNATNAYRNLLPSSSYGFLDSGFKYMYDRYNDKYRYVPLNGDVAGIAARTDFNFDPWFSIGGLNRGQIKGVVKLSLQPSLVDRDNLFKNGVNPVVTFPGQGTVIFGDKTLLARASAFNELGVRRLFIVLEKAIATASKFQLFEFNDAFTRAQFKNLVDPFLRDVQGRRGIIQFRTKCDETNNTDQVVSSNNFVADIFIQPNRSIRNIQLNFNAARAGVSFTEIGG